MPRAVVHDWLGNSFPWTVALDRFGDPPRFVRIGRETAERDEGAKALTYRIPKPRPARRKGA